MKMFECLLKNPSPRDGTDRWGEGVDERVSGGEGEGIINKNNFQRTLSRPAKHLAGRPLPKWERDSSK